MKVTFVYTFVVAMANLTVSVYTSNMKRVCTVNSLIHM